MRKHVENTAEMTGKVILYPYQWVPLYQAKPSIHSTSGYGTLRQGYFRYSLRKHVPAIYSIKLFFIHMIKYFFFQLQIFNIFLSFTQNIDRGYTFESPRRDGTNEYPQPTFLTKDKKKKSMHQLYKSGV